MKGIDLFDQVDFAGQLVADGYGFVMRYLSDGNGTIHKPFLKSEAQHLSDNGLKICSLMEFGLENHQSYFTPGQASLNMGRAMRFVALAGQPQNTAIYDCIDFDAALDEALQNYIITMHGAMKQEGFLYGLYGNGLVLEWANANGYAHYTMLSESQDFAGSQAWKPHADIVQLSEGTYAGHGVDFDVAQSVDFGQWSLKD